jgi:DNA-binding CsgD family transcriptional regulator
MSSPLPRIAALRTLSESRRAELFAQLERESGRLSGHRRLRQSEILRRHILAGESRAILCAEFGVSVPQFYADRREALDRAWAALERSRVPFPIVDQPAGSDKTLLLSNARALFEAGASAAAGRCLDAIDAASLDAVSRLERTALALEVAADTSWAPPSLERLRHDRDRFAPAGLPFDDAAIHWSLMHEASCRPNLSRFMRAFEQTVGNLRAGALVDSRAPIVLARCLVTAAPALVQLGATMRAREAIDEALKLSAARDDMPVALRALAHANRAYVYWASQETLALAGPEREAAYSLALGNALPRTTWVCLYLSVFEHIWRADFDAARADARRLFESAEASDSRTWRDIARSRLSNAYSAAGQLDEAERAIAPLALERPDVPGIALQSCAIEFRRGHYAQALAQASAIGLNVANRAPHFHANALMYSAGAAYRLREFGRASSDISDALSIFEGASGPTLFLALAAFKFAHTITGQTRYRDAARDLQSAFDAGAASRSESPPATDEPGPRLTPRQREIARLAADGATNPAIARALGISTRTVGNHLAAVYAALGIRARWQLRSEIFRR